MKRAFSLVELLVVIGIIGVLAGVLLVSFSGGVEAARAAKCLTNMRNLAQITIATAARTSSQYYPLAGSRAIVAAEEDTVYLEQVGWISWLSKNDEYGMHGHGAQHPKNFVSLDNASAYSTVGDNGDAVFAITNGTVWQCANGNREVYTCPEHVLAAQKAGVEVNWSYVMNAYFGYDWSDGQKAVVARNVNESDGRVGLNTSRLDRTLLFAELPFNDHEVGGGRIETDFSTSPDTANDCVLQYKTGGMDGMTFGKDWSGRGETIAFNHKSGKRWCAHVAFADGHTEKLLLPKEGGGLSKEQLTALLCGDDDRNGGQDVSFNGKSYQKMNN